MTANTLSHTFYNQPAIERNPMTAIKAKYRPVLTAVQIEQILYLAKSEQPLSSMSMSLISTLAPFQAKIHNSALTPAYIIADNAKARQADVMQSLGSLSSLDSTVADPYAISAIKPNGLSKQQYWEACYNKFKLDPISCSLAEIEASQEHAYLNELMSPKELAAFESIFNTEGDL
tara:strand:+ start:12073 stop:12597 length:525 start_codon:yes stop_codon:yes gene_type:complete